jgi:carbamoyl-phosphate synthase large subunit
MRQTKLLAKELHVIGLMNVQFAVKGNDIYIFEVNPRASRTVPFVSKAIGMPLAKLATKIMIGKSLQDLGFTNEIIPPFMSIKESVFPFNKFPNVDLVLTPEMKSTGEVMGIGDSFGLAFAKSQASVNHHLPLTGNVFIDVSEDDRQEIIPIAACFASQGFQIVALPEMASFLIRNGIPTRRLGVGKTEHPNVFDYIKNGQIHLVICTTILGKKASAEVKQIRRAALNAYIPYATTVSAAEAMCEGIAALRKGEWGVRSVQEYHQDLKKAQNWQESKGGTGDSIAY